MIDAAASIIRDDLNSYLNIYLNKADLVVLGNIADFDDQAPAHLKEKVIISNVIIEEESSLKNKRHYQQSSTGSIDYIEPPVYLNLYFLFCATYDKGIPDSYEIALSRISLVIQFFQAKNVFNISTAPFSAVAIGDTLNETQKAEINLRAELYTLTFEQSNHLWGSLGGKQSPFVMYKIRLVKIQERISQDAPLIEEIHESGNSIYNEL